MTSRTFNRMTNHRGSAGLGFPRKRLLANRVMKDDGAFSGSSIGIIASSHSVSLPDSDSISSTLRLLTRGIWTDGHWAAKTGAAPTCSIWLTFSVAASVTRSEPSWSSAMDRVLLNPGTWRGV